MGERPILFSAPMVRALLAGAKTQTRRLVKLRGAESIDETDAIGCYWPWSPEADDWAPCPYGRPGDRLWVKETFNLGRPVRNGEGIVEDECMWLGRLPKEDPRKQAFMSKWCVGYAADGCEGRMWPSIFMPRWASRITLEVTAVRVERLQAISDEDAMAEGAAWRISPDGDLAGAFDTADTPIGYRAHFQSLWESINGAESWTANPWVWVVSFKRVTR